MSSLPSGLSYESRTLPQPTSVAHVGRLAYDEPDEDDRELHAEALEHFEQCRANESEWRERARKELNFLNGEHWDATMKAERQGLPCLAFDRIGPSIDQVTNDTRQSPLAPKVSAVGGGADKYTAELIEGLIRNIENDSDANPSYMTAYEHACQIGRGWWGVLWAYESDEAGDPDNLDGALFKKKLVIRGIPNPFSVYPDPAADKPDYGDMRFCFVTEDLTREAFKEQYPHARLIMGSAFEGPGDRQKNNWYPNGNVRVAEYWRVFVDIKQIALLEGGKVVPADDPAITQDGAIPKAIRDVHVRTIKCFVINGEEILDRWDWEGKSIPLIPVLGKEFISEDKRKFRGMIRLSMDGNLMFDYLSSKLAQGAALAPISQWMVAEGQIEGYQNIWADANRKPYTVLVWKSISTEGQPVPPPQRINPDVEMGGLVQALSVFDESTKASLSTYNPSLGAPGPEQSGRAILARQREGDNAHYNYRDSLGRSMRRTIKVILEMLPHIYDEEQLLTINDPDGKTRTVPINQQHYIAGEARIYKLGKSYGVGRYDVTIGSAPSYATQRQFGFESFMQMLQAAPEVMAPCAGIALRNSDLPDSDKMADIIDSRAGIPPDADSVPMAAQQMIQRLQQQLQVQGALLAKSQSEMERDRLKYASQENIANLQEETKRLLGLLKTGSEEAIAQLQLDMTTIHKRMEQLQTSAETANPEAPVAPQSPFASPPPNGGPGAPPPPGGPPAAPPSAPSSAPPQ